MFRKEVVIDKIKKIELTYGDICERNEKFVELMMVIAWCECETRLKNKYLPLIFDMFKSTDSMHTPLLKNSATNFVMLLVNFAFFQDAEFGEYLFNKYSKDYPNMSPHQFYSVYYKYDNYMEFREQITMVLNETKETEN